MSHKILNSLIRYTKNYKFKFHQPQLSIRSSNASLLNHPHLIKSDFNNLRSFSVTTSKYLSSIISNPKTEEKPTNKKINDKFEDLNSYFLANGCIHPDIISRIIQNLDNIQLSYDQSILLLESIFNLYTVPPSERMKYFSKLWTFLKNNQEINESPVLIALKIFQQNKISLFEAREYLKDIPEMDQLTLYEELIRLTCENGDVEKTTAMLLEEMKEKNLPVTDKVFGALILGHSRNSDIKSCETILGTMNAANLVPSSETLFELLRAYVENGYGEKAEDMLLKNVDKLSYDQILTLFKNAALVNNQQFIKKLIEKLPEDKKVFVEFPNEFKSICIDLIYQDKIDAAFLIIDSFPEPNLGEDQDQDKYGYFFINEMIKSEMYTNDKCLQIINKLIESKKNERALYNACDICLRKYQQKADFYLKSLFQRNEILRPHYFWPLINYNFKKKGEMGILDTIKLMSSLSVDCDYETLYHHCFPRMSILFNNIEETLRHFEKSGLKAPIFLTPLVSHLIIQQKTNEIIKVCELYHSKIDLTLLMTPLANLAIASKINKRYTKFALVVKTLTTKSQIKNLDLAGQLLIELLSNYRFKKDTNMLCDLIIEFNNQEIKISRSSADILQSYLSKMDSELNKNVEKARKTVKEMIGADLNLNSEVSDSNITNPRDMNMNELECHLAELEEKKMNTRGVLRRLLQVYVRENQLEKALEVKNKCNKLGVHISPGMLASILDLQIKLRDLKEAKKAYQEIKKIYPGFLVDEHKILDLATLMVENDNFKQAKELILERTSNTKTIGGEYITRNIWNLLTAVAHYSAKMYPEDNHNLTKDFFFMLKKYRFCQNLNVLLGPIIREYLLKNKVKEAFDEFKFMSETFKRTPLLLELMSLLVKIGNGDDINENYNITSEEARIYLQELVKMSTNVHNAANCNTTLLLAITESGNESQLRKLLISPDFQINLNSLEKSIDHLSANGRTENILKLARACRGMRHSGLTEQDLYKILLNELIKTNNYESAIDLYNKLEADDEIKISTEFVNNLVNLLKINKIEIPNNIALRAQITN